MPERGKIWRRYSRRHFLDIEKPNCSVLRTSLSFALARQHDDVIRWIINGMTEGCTEMIEPGKNIAIKVPFHKWEETVAFYRDRVGLSVTKDLENSTAFAFGSMTLWIDRVETQSQVDVWLELLADDPGKAIETLGSPLRDELEPLGDVNGHWTSDPAGVVLLVCNE